LSPISSWFFAVVRVGVDQEATDEKTGKNGSCFNIR
jgi:hypothetical protein